MKFVFILFLFLIALTAHAQIFTLKVTDYDGLDSIPGVKALIDNEVKKVQSDINDKIPSGSTTRVMKGMSNSSTLAGKSSFADYGSHMEKYQLSFAMGGGVDLERQKDFSSDVSGVGVAPSLVGGANMHNLGVHHFAGLDTKKLDLYVGYLQWGAYQDLDPFIDRKAWLKVNTKSAGAMFGYTWISGQEHKNYTWGGVRLGWGFQHIESHFEFEHDLNFDFDVQGVNSLRGRVTGRPKYNVDVNTNSIPLEISSDVSVFKFLTFYGGAGLDFNWGSAVGRAKADGKLSPIVCTDGGVCTAGQRIQVQAQAGANTQGHVEPVTVRGFVGAQINLPYVQLYSTVNKPVNNEVLGIAVGIRFVR
ncbi:MAG: Lsa36 family surface (lipo)protein [Bacteriovoracaceae bacterium]